ncbi:MAG: hypothetical protein Q4E65_00800 [Clostridia bacterium]|nr:hypothetical protein [Clostridia bacterium]
MRHFSQYPDAFYRAAMDHILQEPLPPLPEDLWDETGYALARMRMRARKGGAQLDDTVKEALFLALWSAARCASPKAKDVRRRLAAKAALRIGKNVPLKDRQAYWNDRGSVAGCIARLLYRDEV